MPKFVIERELPGIGGSSKEELRAVAQKSCGVLTEMGPLVQWVHSYVTADKMYCVYLVADPESVLEHARRGGSPPTAWHG